MEPGEIFDLVTGHSLIDIRGDAFGSVLLVGGRPIALNWCDCGGSVAQYLARAGRADCDQELQALRNTLAGHRLPGVPISSQIYTFLGLFVPGRYQLQYWEACPDCDFIDFDSSWDFAKKHDAFYPYGHTLVCTQSTDSLDQDRVAHYRERIREGHRPIALTATVAAGGCEFVIDGHHKLAAYRSLRINPTLVSVCRIDAPPLDTRSFDEFIGPGHPLARHYKSVASQ